MTTVQNQSSQIYETDLGVGETSLDVNLCVWEPDEQEVLGRVFIDYKPGLTTSFSYFRITMDDDVRDPDNPDVRCKILSISNVCSVQTVKMVDLVVSNNFDFEDVFPYYRASRTGFSDEMRIKVNCVESQ